MILKIFSTILLNIISNLLFWAGGGIVLGFILSRKRRKLFDFFGIDNTKPVIIYLSSLPIQRGTIYDSYGNPSRYQGFVPHGREFQVIPDITKLFSSNTFQRIPDIFSGLIDGIWLLNRPVLEFKLSPTEEDKVEKKDCICIGGIKFNTATRYYLRTANPFIRFSRNGDRWCLLISRGKYSGEKIPSTLNSDANDYDFAVILKMKDPETSSTIFIAGGTGSNGTRAAVEYLIRNWVVLYHIYGDSEFGIGIKCLNREKNPLSYREPDILIKLPY